MKRMASRENNLGGPGPESHKEKKKKTGRQGELAPSARPLPKKRPKRPESHQESAFDSEQSNENDFSDSEIRSIPLKKKKKKKKSKHLKEDKKKTRMKSKTRRGEKKKEKKMRKAVQRLSSSSCSRSSRMGDDPGGVFVGTHSPVKQSLFGDEHLSGSLSPPFSPQGNGAHPRSRSPPRFAYKQNLKAASPMRKGSFRRNCSPPKRQERSRSRARNRPRSPPLRRIRSRGRPGGRNSRGRR